MASLDQYLDFMWFKKFGKYEKYYSIDELVDDLGVVRCIELDHRRKGQELRDSKMAIFRDDINVFKGEWRKLGSLLHENQGGINFLWLYLPGLMSGELDSFVDAMGKGFNQLQKVQLWKETECKETVEILCKALAGQDCRLELLQIWNCIIGQKGVDNIMKSLKHQCHVDLKDVGVTNGNVNSIKQAICSGFMTGLSLGETDIGDHGVEQLCEAIQNPESNMLYLEVCLPSTTSVKNMIRAINSSQCKIEALCIYPSLLQGDELDLDELDYHKIHHLKVHVKGYYTYMKLGVKIVQGFAKLTSLWLWLNINSDSSDRSNSTYYSDFMDDMVNILASTKTLKRFYLKNVIPEDLDEKMVAAIEENYEIPLKEGWNDKASDILKQNKHRQHIGDDKFIWGDDLF